MQNKNKQVKSEPAKEKSMDNKEILNLFTSSECKSDEDISTYAKACVKLNLFKCVDAHLTINMGVMFEIINHVVQGNCLEVLSFIKDYYKKYNDGSKLSGLLHGLKFNSSWRKLQSEWGKIAPYLKVFMNGMYFPFNEELLDTIQELIKENYREALLLDASFREVIRRLEEVPHAKVLKAIRILSQPMNRKRFFMAMLIIISHFLKN